MSSDLAQSGRYWLASPRNGEEYFTFEWDFGVPGVQCPRCGTWGMIGPMLPSVSLEGGPLEDVFRITERTGPVSLERWRKLAAMLQPLLPPTQAVTPGLLLGPIHGKLGKEFEIGWVGLWGLVANAAVTEDVRSVAPDLVAVAARFKNAPDRYFEWELRTAGTLLNVPKKSECPDCGRLRLGMSDKAGWRIRLAKPTSLFRLTEHPTAMVVNDPVRGVLEKNAPSGLDFTELGVELE